jgi:hypothetical protein
MNKNIKSNPYFYKHISIDETIINKLFVAYESMDLNQINEILLSTNINLTNKNNENGLHIILNIDENRYTEEQKYNIIKFLIDKGIDINKYDNTHKTPLHIAVAKQYPDIIELLLNRNANVDYKDDNGMTPLHISMIRLVKKCPEKKIIDKLMKEPEQKELVNNEIYKLITKNLINKIQVPKIKEYYDFIIKNIDNIEEIDISNTIKNIKIKHINELKEKIVNKNLYEGQIQLYANELVKKSIDNITKEIQKFNQKLIEDKLNFGIIEYILGNTTKLPNNNNINIDNTITDNYTIFSDLIGEELLESDIKLNISELDKKLDKINIISYDNNNPENSLYGKCRNMIESNGSVYNLTNNLNNLYLLLNTTVSWLDFLENHHTYNLINPGIIPTLSQHIIAKINTLDIQLIKVGIDTDIIRTLYTNPTQEIPNEYLINTTNPIYEINNKLSNDFQFNNKIFGKYKEKLENYIQRYFETYVSNNINIFNSPIANKTSDNIKLFYDTIMESIINYEKPIAPTNLYKIIKGSNNIFRSQPVQNIIEVNHIPSYKNPIYDNINDLYIRNFRGQLVNGLSIPKYTTTKETTISHIIHKLIIKIKENTDYFSKLENRLKTTLIKQIYEEVINKLLYQYHYIGRLCHIITNEKRKIERTINEVRKYIVDKFKDSDIFIFKDEIDQILLQLSNNVKDLGMDKDKLIELLILQRNNVNSYILELNKLNARRLLADNIKSLNNFEYKINIITKPLPLIIEEDIKHIISNEKPGINILPNPKFYNCMIPLNNEEGLYQFSNNSDNSNDKNKYIIKINTDPLITNLNNGSDNYQMIKLHDQKFNINDFKLFRPFYYIKDIYLNYVKHNLLLEIYNQLLLDNDINYKIQQLAKPLEDKLLYPAIYIKIANGILIEQFKNQAYLTAQKTIVKDIPQLNTIIMAVQPKGISLSQMYSDEDTFELEYGTGKLNIFLKNILADKKYINRKYFKEIDNVEKLYQIGKYNENMCIYYNRTIFEKLKLKSKYNIKDNKGNTPIYYAINSLLTDIITQDLLNNCEVLNIINNNNIRPIELCINNFNSYFKTIYDNNILNFLNNITNKYTEKYHKELISIPDFNNNIIDNTRQSLNKYMILLLFNFQELIFKDNSLDNELLNGLDYNGRFNILDYIDNNMSKTKIDDIFNYINDNNNLNKLFGDYIIGIINKGYLVYNSLFNKYIININDQNHKGLFLYKILTVIDYIINIINEEFKQTIKTKKFNKKKFMEISNIIEQLLPVFKKIEEIMKIYENIKLPKQNILDKNEIYENIFKIQESILLSDLTYNLRDTLLSTFQQYMMQLGSKQFINNNYIKLLTDKLINNKFEDNSNTMDNVETFTGKILLNKLNIKINKTNDPNKSNNYKDISDITNALSTYINTQIFQNPSNQKYKYSNLVEKNILGFYKKNYTLLFEGMQNVFNDFISYYITLGKHLQILFEIINSIRKR